MSNAEFRQWTPDPAERERAASLIEQAVRDENAPSNGPAAIEAVAAFGRLRRMGETDAIARLTPQPDKAADLAARALAAFDFIALENEALNFGCAVPDLVGNDTTVERARPQVLRALAARDRADQILAGAEVLLGRGPVLDEESQLALAEFDAVVRPRLFHAVPVNDVRLAELANVAPQERSRMWWFAQGAEVSSTALDALAVAAELVRHFPEAATELRELSEAEDFFRAVGQPTTDLAHASSKDESRTSETSETPQVSVATALTSTTSTGRGNKGGR
jgi:hypothetical protein